MEGEKDCSVMTSAVRVSVLVPCLGSTSTSRAAPPEMPDGTLVEKLTGAVEPAQGLTSWAAFEGSGQGARRAAVKVGAR